LPAAQSDLINHSTIFSSNNTIYIAGTYPSSSTGISNIVYKLEF
jgi:hypothetical protein